MTNEYLEQAREELACYVFGCYENGVDPRRAIAEWTNSLLTEIEIDESDNDVWDGARQRWLTPDHIFAFLLWLGENQQR